MRWRRWLGSCKGRSPAREETMVREYKYLINGEWRGSGEAVEIRSPYNGEVAGITFMASPQDVEAAVQGAADAFQETRKIPTYRRAEILERIVQRLKAEQETMARLIALEAGKPIRLARAAAGRGGGALSDSLEECKRIRGECLPLDLDASSCG